MTSKKLVQSNAKNDIHKSKAIKKKEPPKPPRRYEPGHTVYINRVGVPFHNALIVGYEWGGDNLKLCSCRPMWYYWIVDVAARREYRSWLLVAEDQIADRISI